ncbi:MAG: hypothetical protein ACQEP2_01370 [Actinomycetota bacterium]
MTFWHARNEKPYPGGITAVYSTSLTREGIFQGLENGRIYASSDYGRPCLDITIIRIGVRDGSRPYAGDSLCPRWGLHPQNSQAPIDSSKWNLDWNATIEILKNGQLWHSVKVTQPVTGITLVDSPPVTGTEYGLEKCIQKCGKYYINNYSYQPIGPSKLNTDGSDFYIIRAVSASGREAYIGPVWVSVK